MKNQQFVIIVYQFKNQQDICFLNAIIFIDHNQFYVLCIEHQDLYIALSFVEILNKITAIINPDNRQFARFDLKIANRDAIHEIEILRKKIFDCKQ